MTPVGRRRTGRGSGGSLLFLWKRRNPREKGAVEYLYLDLKTCDRCIGTDTVLDEVMAVLAPALQLAGYLVEYSKIEMKTAELAERYRFISSPTIRVNGLDICGSVKESACSCCGEISGTDVDCRVFEYNGEVYEIPQKRCWQKPFLKRYLERLNRDAPAAMRCRKI
jgi:hypothetical protein